jgi:hypothetical protein
MELRREKLGGEEVKTLRLQGEESVRGKRGPITIAAATGGRYASRWQAGTSFERVVNDGEHVWIESGDDPRHERTGVFREETELVHPFFWFGDWSERWPATEVLRREHGAGGDLLVLRLTPKLLPPITRYVSAESGELVREEGYLILRGVGPVGYEMTLEDHRDAGGVRLPFRVTTKIPKADLEIVEKFEHAELDVELPPEVFRLGDSEPAAEGALKR